MRGGWVSELNPKFLSVEQQVLQVSRMKAVGLVISFSMLSLMLCSRVERNGAERSESGLGRPELVEGSEGRIRSAVIGKISGWGRAFSIFRWTYCSGPFRDVLFM